MSIIAVGTVVRITNVKGTVKGVSHIVKRDSMFGNAAVDTRCGQTFLTAYSRTDSLSKIATATANEIAQCATCSR
jgi:hypothetical protein